MYIAKISEKLITNKSSCSNIKLLIAIMLPKSCVFLSILSDLKVH